MHESLHFCQIQSVLEGNCSVFWIQVDLSCVWSGLSSSPAPVCPGVHTVDWHIEQGGWHTQQRGTVLNTRQSTSVSEQFKLLRVSESAVCSRTTGARQYVYRYIIYKLPTKCTSVYYRHNLLSLFVCTQHVSGLHAHHQEFYWVFSSTTITLLHPNNVNELVVM